MLDNLERVPQSCSMGPLTDYTTYADAQRHFSGAALWALFDGDRDRLNITHECIDRWAGDPSRVAIRIAYADGSDETLGHRIGCAIRSGRRSRQQHQLARLFFGL